MSTHLPVGVFDSGVGGLSVVQAIRDCLPGLDMHYVADSAHAPYGEKTPQQVLERCRTLAAFLLDQGAGSLVVACNTATAQAVDQLRQEFAIPIIAMEPAVKPAARATRSGVVGVLATAGTLESERYRRLVDSHGNSVQVISRVCTDWVRRVEGGELSGRQVHEMVQRDIQPLLNAGADTLVLGCTHFPFLKPVIEAVAGADVEIIDPAPAVANQLAKALSGQVQGSGNITFWSTRQATDESHRLSRLLKEPVSVNPL